MEEITDLFLIYTNILIFNYLYIIDDIYTFNSYSTLIYIILSY